MQRNGKIISLSITTISDFFHPHPSAPLLEGKFRTDSRSVNMTNEKRRREEEKNGKSKTKRKFDTRTLNILSRII
jgi:hypothetical protein